MTVAKEYGGDRVYCRHCALEVEGCRGVHGQWMHTNGHSEFCSDETTLAQPETSNQVKVGFQNPGKAGGRKQRNAEFVARQKQPT